MSISCPHCLVVAGYGSALGHKTGCPELAEQEAYFNNLVSARVDHRLELINNVVNEWAEGLMDSQLAMQTICTILNVKKPSQEAIDWAMQMILDASCDRKLQFITWLTINKIYPYHWKHLT